MSWALTWPLARPDRSTCPVAKMDGVGLSMIYRPPVTVEVPGVKLGGAEDETVLVSSVGPAYVPTACGTKLKALATIEPSFVPGVTAPAGAAASVSAPARASDASS